MCGVGHDGYLQHVSFSVSHTRTHSGDDDDQRQLSLPRLEAAVVLPLEIGRAIMLLFVHLLLSQ